MIFFRMSWGIALVRPESRDNQFPKLQAVYREVREGGRVWRVSSQIDRIANAGVEVVADRVEVVKIAKVDPAQQ